MSKLRFIYSLFLLLFISTVIISCTDDFFKPNPLIGNGYSDINAQIVFSSVTHNISNTRAENEDGTPGNAIKHINNLCVVIYDKDQKFYKLIPEKELNPTYKDNEPTTSPSDAISDSSADQPHQAEEITPKANFTIKNIPFGEYYIYAVANMDDLKDYYDENNEINRIQTPEDLKDISLEWNSEDIPANNQMFGYFTPSSQPSSNGFDAPKITVNTIKTELHAWLKRAASKVTVAVDGSGLYNDVQVWIKSIQVKDIPELCFLGRDNVVSSHLIEQGAKIVLSSNNGSDGDEAINLVEKGHNYPLNTADAHKEDAKALFFYENMQGEGQLKSQVWPEQGNNPSAPMFPDGNSPGDPGYKDSKISGTYVEVIGYYKNNEGEGPIIYRFMLGKNITTNYDAQRNYHFKLTLVLKNNANDNDWHIVYNQEPEILVRTPFYVSYLYNQRSNYDFKVVGGTLLRLEAIIPDDDVTKKSWAPKDGDVVQEDITAAYATLPPGSTVGGDVYWTGSVNNPGPWNGFISLRQETASAVAADGYGIWPDATNNDKFGPSAAVTYQENKNHWDTYNQGSRVYWDNGSYYEPGHEDYEIEAIAPNEYNCNIPLYTKARVMVSQTGYTGNNPYAAYNRASKVTFIATFKEIDEFGQNKTATIDVEVIQGRRVMNPKAIWRKADSTDEFRVLLKILPYQTATKFENLISDGPWRAEISTGDSWIQITPTENSQLNPDGSISGKGDPYDENNNVIDFIIRPKGTTSSPRGGYVTVHYNNYTCTHTIFVRQGYEPVEFKSCPNVMWHTYNLRTGGINEEFAVEAVDPEVEGSYFRYRNRQYPIDPRSNTSSWAFKDGIDRDFFIALPDYLATDTKKWEQIKIDPLPNEWGNFKVEINGKPQTSRLPKKEEWQNILKNSNTLFGYGVLYADGAKETLEDTNIVYGATPDDHDTGKGMRGLILCDSSDGTQIFLPLGTSGYGRFKQKSPVEKYNRLPAGWGGVIQYANRYYWFPSTGDWNVSYKPLFYDLWEGEGTLYWTEDEGQQPYALDINFNTLDVAVSTAINELGLIWDSDPDPSGSDAIHIRLVHDK